MHWPGIEPGPPAWQARILPLNHQCLAEKKGSLFYYLNLPTTLDIVKDRYSRSKLFKKYKTDTNIPWQHYSQIITR